MFRKTKRRIWRNVFILLFLVFLIIPMMITIYLYNQAFGGRVDTMEDGFARLQSSFPGFQRTAASFPSDQGQELQGYFYYYDQASVKGLIVMAHGMGGGHASYLTEAQYLCANGYLVFAYDNTGTNESEGDSLIGLSQSGIDLHHALTFLEQIPALRQYPLMLYGHSWGGFAVATVSNYPHSVTAIVSVAGFEENSNVLKQQGRAMVGDFISLFMPYVNLYERLLFGSAASHTGISGLSNTDARVMIIHSEDDSIVDYQENFMHYRAAFDGDPRFTFLSLTSQGHGAVLKKSSAAADAELPKEIDEEIMDQVVRFFDEF